MVGDVGRLIGKRGSGMNGEIEVNRLRHVTVMYVTIFRFIVIIKIDQKLQSVTTYRASLPYGLDGL